MSLLISTVHFTYDTRSNITFPQIVRTIKICIRITIWIGTQCCLVNCRSIIFLCYSIIAARFIIKSHIAVRVQVSGIRNGNIGSHCTTNIYTHWCIFTTFGSNKNNPFRSTATIERYSSSVFQYRHTLHLCSSDIASTTWHTVN